MAKMTQHGVRRVKRRPPPSSAPWWPGGSPSFRSGTEMLMTLMIFSVLSITEGSSADTHLHFTSSLYNVSVPENALDETPVISDEMMGIFIHPEDPVIRFRIFQGDPDNIFRVNSRMVGDFCFLEISVRTSVTHNLNRERRDMYSLHIRAQYLRDDRTRMNIPGAITIVRVQITDLDDLSPLFAQPEYHVMVNEDLPVYSSIIQVHAEDPDIGLNGEIYYSFREPSSVFCIHPTLGIVTLTRTLHFHERSIYNLTLSAQDRGPQSKVEWPALSKLIINVLEVNVYEPQIKISYLEEMSPKGHLLIIAIVTVLDNDAGISGLVGSLEIVEGDPDRVFRIVSGTENNEFSLAALSTINWIDAPHGYNLTLKATDRGSIPRFSYKDVYVAPPTRTNPVIFFTQKNYEFSISEAAPPGSFIASLGTWIPGTQNREVYYISEETNVHRFALEPTSGTLTTVRPLDAETVNSYTFKVVAEASKKLEHSVESVNIKINVLDANDNTPMIVAPQGVVQMDENKPANTWVVKVRAQDYDFGKNGDVSYSLANGEEIPFTIDHFTGEVRTNKVLDYESERRIWKLLVRASDWGEPYRRQTEKIITIHVQDVNDNNPIFERTDCSGYIDRSAPMGTEIFTLSAVDFDAGNIISYRILDGNEDRCFNLDTVKGVITLICDLQDMDANERILNVTATDGLHFAESMALRLQLVQPRGTTSNSPWADLKCREMYVAQQLTKLLAESTANNQAKEDIPRLFSKPSFASNIHSPTIINPPKDLQITENSEIGSVILELEASDADSGYDGYIVYSITGGNFESVFRMDVNTGELKISGNLDRERVDKYILNLTAYDLGVPQRFTSHVLGITILDENDNAPKFDKVAYSFFLPESVTNGTNVYQLRANDPDQGRFGSVTYALATDTRDFFMNPLTGQLSVSRQLDYETNEVYELRVISSDMGGLTAQTYVMVQVADVNDCAPKFSQNGDNYITIQEDLPIGSLVTLINAYDADSSNLRYTIDDGNNASTFSVDADSGAVRLAKLLDYETRPIYNITIRATDDGLPPLSSTTFLIIEVSDVNENVHSPVFGGDVAEASVSESSPPHTLVTSVPAVDGDLGLLDSSISYSIVGDTGRGLFYIDQKGDIYTSGWLDRETTSHYWLKVRASDAGTVSRHSTLHVYIQVTDVNDNIPRSILPVHWPLIEENAPPNTLVVTLKAEDFDPGAIISYAIAAGNPQSLFAIDAATGTITTTGRKLDREQQEEHVLEVVIQDNPDPRQALSSTAMVIVKVLDQNDHSPTFLRESYSFTVPFIESFASWSEQTENEIELVVGQVVAGDEDYGDNSAVTYRLMEESLWQGMFRVHPVTGIITMRKPNSSGKRYTLAVKAEDRGASPRWSSVEVVVQVLSVSRTSSGPRLSSPSAVQLSVAEDSPVGHVIHDVEASDPDGDHLWYTLLDGGSSGAVAVDNRGNILVAGRLDVLKKKLYNISVEVTDGFNKIIAQYVVNIVSSNRHRPRFSLPIYQVEISEDTKPGTALLSLAATDEDDTLLSYKIISYYHTGINNVFSVEPVRGEIILAAALDREVQDHHFMTVLVSDRGTPPKRNYCHVKVTVTDHNDHPPVFALDVYNTSVAETVEAGTGVVQVLATDRDAGANGRVTYTIVSGNLRGALSIDPDTGLLSLQRSLERRQTPNFLLKVRASDGGVPSRHSHATVRIAVTLPQTARPRFLQSNIVFEVSEAAKVGDYLGSLQVESPNGVVFFLSRNQNEGNVRPPVLVNPSSGVVILDAPLDYEQIQSYNMTVTATSMGGEFSRANIILTVRDENDHAPTFTQNNYWGEISEAAAIGTVVIESLPPAGTSSSYVEFSRTGGRQTRPLVVKAEDKDADHNADLIFVIVETHARDLFTIDSSTGAIRSARFLDHESEPLVQFSVSVRDGGEPTLAAAAVATVTINITDVNDVPPKFRRQEYDATIWIPTQNGVLVAQLTATDEDFDNTAPLEYAIADGNTEDIFSIDASNGLVTIRDATILKNSYKLKVTASDGQLSTSTSLNIRASKLPHSSLHFTQDKYFGRVQEENAAITRVVLVQAIGSDLNEHLTYRLLTPTPFFTIGETSGVLQTTKQPCDREKESYYLLLVEVNSARASAGSRAAQVQVHVVVIDTNDHPPVFYGAPYYGLVKKTSKQGTVVFKVDARDRDEGDNGLVRYELLSETAGLVSQEQGGGGDSRVLRNRGRGKTSHAGYQGRGVGKSMFVIDPESGHVRVAASFHAQEDEYHLEVRAFDAGTPSLSSKTRITLRLVEEYEPVFEHQYYAGTVEESAEPGQPVLTVTAKCPQDHPLLYTMEPQGPFELEHKSGVIRVIDVLDYEERDNYTVTARATDTITGHWVEVFVNILILDVNDNAPKFHHQYFNPKISEAASQGTSVLKILTKDKDTGKNAGVSYRIETINGTEPVPAFFIHSGTGLITIKSALDRETLATHVFLVVATDTGVPPLSASALVVVTVTDMNDNGPRFDKTLYMCEISEGANRGQFVTMVTATDADEGGASALKYVLVGGNDLQAFKMEQDTGMLRVWNNDQLSSRPVHYLNVTVSDGVFSSRTRLAVTVSPVNRRAPVFKKDEYRVSVEENRPADTVVVRVEAEDPDMGRYGEVTYRLLGDEANAVFAVDETSGIVRSRKMLDREGHSSQYSLTVAAEDWGSKVGYATIVVQVADDNDNKPVFEAPRYRALLSANASAGSHVIKVRATDKDAGENGTVVYRLHETTSDLIKTTLSVGPLSGDIALLRDIHYMSSPTLEFFIEATDQGRLNYSQKSSVPVVITVVKPGVFIPHFHSPQFTFTVREDAEPGSQVGSVEATWRRASNASPYDMTASHVSELQYSVSWSDDNTTPPVDVSPQAVLFLASKLDSEAVSEVMLTVTAVPKVSPEIAVTATVRIIVEDVNDDVPKFESIEYRVTLGENTPTGSSVLKVSGRDGDSSGNADLRYLLLESDHPLEEQPLFTADPYTGWLTLNAGLDAEERRQYNLKVEVRDSGRPALSSTAMVVITVKDYNDNPPLFREDSPDRVEVAENAAIGSMITKLEISDADSDFSYHNFFIVSGNDRQDLSINQQGELKVQKILDREDIDRYQLEIAVTDGLFTTTTKLQVLVTDVNDNPPLCTTSYYQHTVSEAALPGTLLLRVTARDPDLSSSPRYFISGQGSNRFSMDSATGKLSILKRLDREKHRYYSIKVRVRDGGVPQWQCFSEVHIAMTDANDSPPRFTQSSYTATVPENSPAAQLLLRVNADDPDSGINQRVSYFLVDSSSIISSTFSRTKDGLFELDSTTGILKVTKTLDREEQAMYNLTIEARDHGTPPMSSQTTVIVHVDDVNDNPPEFPRLWYEVVVSEGVSVGQEILQVTATSKDVGKNAAISYKIVGGNDHGKLSINPDTGAILIMETLNYERARQYLLTVRATDDGQPPLSTDVAVNVTVTDINDNSPIFSQNEYTVLIAEDADVGEKLIQVTASDQDSGSNGEVEYRILEGDPNGRFSVDALTGWISVQKPLDREKEAIYNLMVVASDHGMPQRSGSALVSVEIRDANDNAPVVSYSNRTLYLQEDRQVGVRLLRLKVSDADGDSGGNGGPFAFELLSGNTRGDFRITQNGDLLTAESFAGRGLPAYRLQVRVHDNGRPHLHTDVWLSVQVVESSKFHPVVFPLHVMMMIPTDDYVGGSLGEVRASDKDPHDQLYYNIAQDSNLSQGLFKIDINNGSISNVRPLTEGHYNMNISVSDGKFITYSPAEIRVKNVDDVMIAHGQIIILGGASPGEFLLSYRTSFLRSIRNILDVDLEDVFILSIQASFRKHRRLDAIKAYNFEEEFYTEFSPTVDTSVLFCVRKLDGTYVSRKKLHNSITSEVSLMESTMGLRVLRLEGNMCHNVSCANGRCEDVISLDETPIVVTTEAVNFVSMKHRHEGICICPTGYAGKLCDQVLNECAFSPCPKYKECVPSESERGYSCICPDDLVGATCSKRVSECLGFQHTPACYNPSNPISFAGKSFTQYNVRTTIDNEFEFSTWFRTIEPSGNIMFISGRIDYSILEIYRGRVRYRWELGTGEGVITVSSSPTLNDSNWHHVTLKHYRKSAKLIVDDLFSNEGLSPGISEQLNLETSQMYLGAEVRPWVDEEDTLFDFEGCLDNPHLNHAALPVNEIMSTVTAALVRSYQIIPFCPDKLEPVGICGSHPCSNGAICKEDGTSFKCICKTRFKGKQCEIDTDPCVSSPCLNNGRCIQDGYSYKCQCPAHVSGNRCQYLYCSPNPCLNHGSCEEGTSGPICRCDGFKGVYCNVDINECESSPCHGGGTCINTYGGFNCLCPSNTAGDDCNETKLLPLMPKMQEVATVVGVIVSLIATGLLTLLAIHCRGRRENLQEHRCTQDHHSNIILKHNGSNKHSIYANASKINNLDKCLDGDGYSQRPQSSNLNPALNECAPPVDTLDVTQIYDRGGGQPCLDTPPQYSREYIVLGKLNTFNLHNLPPPSHVHDQSTIENPNNLDPAAPSIHLTVQPPPAFAVHENEFKYATCDLWTPDHHSTRSSPMKEGSGANSDPQAGSAYQSSYQVQSSSSTMSPNCKTSVHSHQEAVASSPSILGCKRPDFSTGINNNTTRNSSFLTTFECRKSGEKSSCDDHESSRGEGHCQGQPCGVVPMHNPPDLVPTNDSHTHAASPGPQGLKSQIPFGVHYGHRSATSEHTTKTLERNFTFRSERSNSLSSSQTLCPTKLASENKNKRFGTLPRSLAIVSCQKQVPSQAETPENDDKWRAPKKVEFITPLPTNVNSEGKDSEMISRV